MHASSKTWKRLAEQFWGRITDSWLLLVRHEAFSTSLLSRPKASLAQLEHTGKLHLDDPGQSEGTQPETSASARKHRCEFRRPNLVLFPQLKD